MFKSLSALILTISTNIHEMVEKAIEWLIPALAVFIGSSLAGVAQQLWEAQEVPLKKAVGGALISGFAGVIAFLVLYEHLQQNLPLLIGVSLISGVGGSTSLDLMAAIITTLIKRHLKIETIKIEKSNGDEPRD